MGLRWNGHALLRLREFYPNATAHDMRSAVKASELIAPEVGATLRGMGKVRDTDRGDYLLHPERTGMFIRVWDGTTATVITFLRFYSLQQHRLAVELYGPGEPVSDACTARWAQVQRAAPAPLEEESLWRGHKVVDIRVSKAARRVTGGADVVHRALAMNQGRDPTPEELQALEAHRFPPALWCLDHRDRVLTLTEHGDRLCVGLMPKHVQRATLPGAELPTMDPPVLELPAVRDHPGDTVLPTLGAEIRLVRVVAPVLERLGVEGKIATLRAWVRARLADIDTSEHSRLAHACLDGEWQRDVYTCRLLPDLKVWIANRWRPDDREPEWTVLHQPPHRPSDREIELANELHGRGWVVVPPLWLPERSDS